MENVSNTDGFVKNFNKWIDLATEPIEEPYTITICYVRNYNPKFGDDRMCECGHVYHRHFDSWEDMDPCGCKYCCCDTFKEAIDLKK